MLALARKQAAEASAAEFMEADMRSFELAVRAPGASHMSELQCASPCFHMADAPLFQYAAGACAFCKSIPPRRDAARLIYAFFSRYHWQAFTISCFHNQRAACCHAAKRGSRTSSRVAAVKSRKHMIEPGKYPACRSGQRPIVLNQGRGRRQADGRGSPRAGSGWTWRSCCVAR